VSSSRPKKIWIDLDNSPHVPFFVPIIEALRQRGYSIVLTARDSYQVRELLRFHRFECKIVGHHWGKHLVLKVLGTVVRAVQLLPVAMREKVDLAVSHGSRGQILSARFAGVPVMAILDYEFASRVSLHPDWILVPELIPESIGLVARKQVLRYPGLKEDVYIPQLRPDPSVKTQLGLSEADLIVTVRPPATEAHYHNREADVLLDAALDLLTRRSDVRVVLVPRNKNQDQALRKQWHKWIVNRKIVIPEHVVDGLNLIWFSDLVISGGGTMNREAASLGVPVYSIFRGRIGAVDRYLGATGRLVLLESEEDVQTKVRVVRRERPAVPGNAGGVALRCIIERIVTILESKNPVS